LEKEVKVSLKKLGVPLYPDVVDPRFLQNLPQRWIYEGRDRNFDISHVAGRVSLSQERT
jgi:hypothetical protein